MSITVDVGAMEGFVWPPHVDAALYRAASVIRDSTAHAIGTGRGGAGNDLPALQESTVKKKGHAQQLFETGALQGSITLSGSNVVVGAGVDHGPGKDTSDKVAGYLAAGTGKNAKSRFLFMGLSGRDMAWFVADVCNEAAKQLGGKADDGIVALLNHAMDGNVSGGWADPGDAEYEVDISEEAPGALRRSGGGAPGLSRRE